MNQTGSGITTAEADWPDVDRLFGKAQLKKKFDGGSLPRGAGHRRRGAAPALLSAVVEHARNNGAATVEGYPVDSAQRPKAGAADVYHRKLDL